MGTNGDWNYAKLVQVLPLDVCFVIKALVPPDISDDDDLALLCVSGQICVEEYFVRQHLEVARSRRKWSSLVESCKECLANKCPKMPKTYVC